MSAQITDPLQGLLQTLKIRLTAARKEHESGDAWYYNGGTFLVLLFTSAASLMPSIAEDYPRLIVTGQILAAAAAILVGTERSLSFGARWRYHREMKSAYDSLLDMLEYIPILPESERNKYLAEFWEELKLVRR